MDSREVNREIRRVIRPWLKEKGFDAFAERWSWRHRQCQVDCIRFWSPYNWVEAELKGITTYSFQINMGIYWLDIPPEGLRPKEKNGHLLPGVHQCHIQRDVHPPVALAGPSMPFIWYIDPEGANLGDVMVSAREALAGVALPWFDRLSEPQSFLDLLLTTEGHISEDGWGYGGKDSKWRNYLTGYMARKCGQRGLAVAHLEAYLETSRELSKRAVSINPLTHHRVESDIAVMRAQAAASTAP